MGIKEAIAAVGNEIAAQNFDKLQKAMRILIQELQKQQKTSSEALLEPEILKMYSNHLDLILSEDCPIEISLLSGTTLFLIFYKLVPLPAGVDCIWSLLSPRPDATYSCDTNGHRSAVWQILESKHIQLSEDQLPFFKLVVSHGILSARKQDFLQQTPTQSGKCLFFLLAHQLVSMCQRASSYPFQVFQALASWMKMAESIAAMVPGGQQELLVGSELISALVTLLEANWESSVRGVAEFVKEIYSELLKINNNFTQKSGDPTVETLAASRWTAVASMSWKQKGKYIGLALLVPYVSTSQLESLDLPHHLIANLSVNHLFSSIANLYRCLVTSLRKSNETEAEFLEAWNLKWGSQLLKALNSDQQLIKTNILRHLLPWTLKQLPGATQLLLRDCPTEENLASKLIVARLGRQNGLISLSDLLESGYLPLYPYHADPDIRLEALALVCSSAKKSDPPPGEQELCIALQLVLSNMAVDSAPFRYDLTRHLRNLLERLRDSCLKLQPVPAHTIDFVESLIKICVSNVFPGAAYQRRLMALSIFRDLCATFTGTPALPFQKVIGPIQESGKWNFLLEANFSRILVCIMDSVDEVRHQTAEILASYFPPPTGNRVKDLATLSWRLCDSPQSQECDGGAYLAALLFSRVLPHQPIPFQDGQACTSQEDFLHLLLTEAKAQHCLAQGNPLEAAVKKPIHGILLALNRCCTDDPRALLDLCASQKSKMAAWLDALVSLCQDITADMLALTGVSTEDDCAPSFEEMNLSITNKLEEILGAKCSDDQFQLVMALCWLSIKESTLLLGNLVSTSLGVISLSTLSRIADILTSILFRCRHKGAIEAGRFSFENFCRALLKSPNQDHRAIPESILMKVFSHLTLKASGTSMTRRSAGLSLLVHSLVVAEPGWKQRKLVKLAMEQLLDLTSKSEGQDESGKVDIPRAHGFHITRELVNDSSLSRDVLPWMSRVVPVCFDGFTSSSWAVRNGALQLYGAVILRLVGQKKVRDEDSVYNGCTPLELFSKHPGLRDFLVQLLTASVDCHRRNGVADPGLVPCLSFLARLVPDPSRWEEIAPFKPLLVPLLSSPVWTVRVLAAAVLADFEDCRTLLPTLISNLDGESPCSWNLVHASLLALEKLLPDCPLPEQETVLSSVAALGERSASCGVVQALCLKILNAYNYGGHVSLPESGDKPGHPLLKKETFLWQIRTSPLGHTCKVLHWGLTHFDSCQDIWELTLQCLEDSAQKLQKEEVEQILSQLGDMLDLAQGSILLQVVEALVQLCPLVDKAQLLTMPVIGKLYDRVSILAAGIHEAEVPVLVRPQAFLLWSHLLHYSSRFVGGILWLNRKHASVDQWSQLLLHMAQPDQPAETRTLAARGLTPGLNGIENLNGPVLLRVFEACLLLLQDENELVRMEAAMFVSQFLAHTCFCGQIKKLQSHVAIQVWTSWVHCRLKQDRDYLWHLANRLYPDSVQSTLAALFIKGDYKMFEQEEINLHAEPITVSYLFAYLLKDAIEETNKDFWNTFFILSLSKTLQDAQFAHKFLLDLQNQNSVNCLSKSSRQNAALVNFSLHCQLLLTIAPWLDKECPVVLQDFCWYLRDSWGLDEGGPVCWQMDRWYCTSADVTMLAI